ncbi:hypothetical protein B5E84_11135 [Lachnoclostridium sp. An14]|nr:hypothetical protein B5E84_11135 [Lachnoclostridium sp. An14]
MPLLINVAKLYYESGYSQNEIAQQLGISRPYVSKLLMMAREENVVSIKIQDPLQTESRLEHDIRSFFQLRRVIVTPSKVGENHLFTLGEATAKYLDSIVKKDDIVMAGWGRTIYAVSKKVIERSDLENVTVVSMGGIPTNFTQNVFGFEPVVNLAGAWCGMPYILPAPVMIRDPEAREGFLREQSIAEVMEYMERANIALFTMGDLNRSSYWTQKGYMTDEEWQHIMEQEAVGDVCLHILNKEGNICDETIDKKLIALPLEKIKQKEYRIGVASGREKIDITYAALKAGIINVLIVDEDIAKAVIVHLHQEGRYGEQAEFIPSR